ncbi:MAG: type II toxin-antitoxin system RelE/ParE family toxin [Gemmatimonadetes bacterium]|nr:type II toxin-antitoxin system RelE/ParE family toxin [Gemmatimonadota bacterium]
MRVRFTSSARRQFLEGLDFIRQDKPSAARRTRQRVETALRRLEDHPDSGRRIPEFPELPHREVIVKPFRFFYRIEKQTVWIVAAWHGAQLPEEP